MMFFTRSLVALTLILAVAGGQAQELTIPSIDKVPRINRSSPRPPAQVLRPSAFIRKFKEHPVTGRKALYGVCGSSFGIVGMPEDEACQLLDELAVHATASKFQTKYDFKIDDAGAWDTYSTLHKATLLKPATGPHDSRLLWRLSLIHI